MNWFSHQNTDGEGKESGSKGYILCYMYIYILQLYVILKGKSIEMMNRLVFTRSKCGKYDYRKILQSNFLSRTVLYSEYNSSYINLYVKTDRN